VIWCSSLTTLSDVPSTTGIVCHDVEVVGVAIPCKQHPYQVNPLKLQAMQKEIEYMLENSIIEYSHCDWISPCVLVPKPLPLVYRRQKTECDYKDQLLSYPKNQ